MLHLLRSINVSIIDTLEVYQYYDNTNIMILSCKCIKLQYHDTF